MNIEQNPYAAPTADLSDAGAEWLHGDSPGLAKTSQGLGLVYSGIIIVILSLLCTMAGSVVESLLYVSMTGLVIGALLMFIGPLLCLAVPPETNAKGLIVASVIFQLINTVMVVVSMFSILPMMQGIGQLFGFISAVLFVLFMRRLALFVGRQDLADRARNILILGAITVVVSMLGLFSLIVPAMGMLFLGVGVLGIIMFVMYANLVNYLRLALKPSSM